MAQASYLTTRGKSTMPYAPNTRHLDSIGVARLPCKIVQDLLRKYTHQVWLSRDRLKRIQDATEPRRLALPLAGDGDGAWVPLVPNITASRVFDSPNELKGMQVNQSAETVIVERRDGQSLHY